MMNEKLNGVKRDVKGLKRRDNRKKVPAMRKEDLDGFRTSKEVLINFKLLFKIEDTEDQ